MQASVPVSNDIYTGQPIVMAVARFKNGIWVASGILKSDKPDEFNIKFCNTFDQNGKLIYEPYQPIDVSDHEDFMHNGFLFSLNEDETEMYLLKIRERNA